MWSAAGPGRDVVGERAVRPRVAVVGLLAQHGKRCRRRGRCRRPPRAPARSRRRRAAGSASVAPRSASRSVGRVVVELPRRRLLEDRREPALRSQAWKKNCQSTYGAQLGDRRLDRARARRTAAAAARRTRPGRGSRAPPRAAAAACASRSACWTRRRSCRPRFSLVELARRAGSSSGRRRRRRATRRGRARSRCEYAGAIRTAVCCRDVVAPPISSGSSSPRRSISEATSTISSSDGVISPESPTTCAPPRRAVSRIRSAGTITPRSTTS